MSQVNRINRIKHVYCPGNENLIVIYCTVCSNIIWKAYTCVYISAMPTIRKGNQFLLSLSLSLSNKNNSFTMLNSYNSVVCGRVINPCFI